MIFQKNARKTASVFHEDSFQEVHKVAVIMQKFIPYIFA